MTPHTTHFDDCGCAAEQHLAEVRKIAAERDALRAEVARLREQKKYAADECVRMSNENVALRAEVERLREALDKIKSIPFTAENGQSVAWELADAALKEAGDGNREA